LVAAQMEIVHRHRDFSFPARGDTRGLIAAVLSKILFRFSAAIFPV
jgi:hypothetical protein